VVSCSNFINVDIEVSHEPSLLPFVCIPVQLCCNIIVGWLPVYQQITFKLAVITFKCLCGLAPSYLADVCITVSSVVGRWQLRSADSGTLVVPRTRTTIGRETLLCQARPHGTAFPSNCGLHHCLLRRLQKNSKLIYSAASASEDFCLTGAIWIYVFIHSFMVSFLFEGHVGRRSQNMTHY